MKQKTKLQMSAFRCCQECGKTYSVDTPGSGYKYCSRHCAKNAQQKQVAAWEAKNSQSVQEWRDWWRMQKFRDKLAEYEEQHLPN